MLRIATTTLARRTRQRAVQSAYSLQSKPFSFFQPRFFATNPSKDEPPHPDEEPDLKNPFPDIINSTKRLADGLNATGESIKFTGKSVKEHVVTALETLNPQYEALLTRNKNFIKSVARVTQRLDDGEKRCKKLEFKTKILIGALAFLAAMHAVLKTQTENQIEKTQALQQAYEELEKKVEELLPGSAKALEKEIRETLEAIRGDLTEDEQALKQKIASLYDTLRKNQPTYYRQLLIEQISLAQQSLQTKYNDSFSGYYVLSLFSQGHAHQYKIRALEALKQHLMKQNIDDEQHVIEIPNELLEELKTAYSYSPEAEDVQFKENTLVSTMQLPM